MLNRVILMGRITQDLEMRQTPNGNNVLTFNVAVDRSFAKQGEDRQTDFITCVAWGQRAEFINRYFSKGRMIAIEGSLRTRTYDDKNGSRHYVTEVYVDNTSFTGEPKQQSQGSYQNSYNSGYQNNNYQQNNYQQNNSYSNNQPQQNNYNNAPANDSLNIGDLDDFEVLSDDGVPF
ncbi:MAG: single-stranded DNA-binding protein [Oscillospiraceae bacterium]